ncbi:MAG TPA: type II restriction endonuclease [Flavobacteriales bacterium]|nr:type II restriction endonuclease [Flavobacteriales bacterium]
MKPTLANVFQVVAHKRLVLVDLPGKGSNQHELNGVTALREFFQTGDTVKAPIVWHYFADDRDAEREEGTFTFYDARAKSATRTGRSEWRFYYTGDFLHRCEPGDELIFVKPSGILHALVFRKDSARLRAALVLFGIGQSGDQLQLLTGQQIAERDLDLLRRHVIDELELDIELPVMERDKELVLRQFGERFPTTAVMSAFARSQVQGGGTDPDGLLVAWLDREEQLFRALEDVIIGKRLQQGFDSVADFIKYSLSVQNRRKSRMGHALEHHLAEVFTREGLRFTAQARTEAGNRPDFIFPGEAEYHDPAFNPTKLIMLGAKSTAKDRWRQILPEAARIPKKHLCTMEPGISEKQIHQMEQKGVRLVIPRSIMITYSEAQVKYLDTLGGFIDHVRSFQRV